MTDTSRVITIHAGLPKTGSTYLQQNVFPFAAGGTYCTPRFGFTGVVEALARDARPALISDERLTWPPLDEPQCTHDPRLKKLALLRHSWPDAGLILMLREPWQMICSHYAQYLHHGGTAGFAEFHRQHIQPEAFYLDRFLERILAQRWRDLLILDHRELRADPSSVIRKIETFSQLRFRCPQAASQSPSNPSVAATGARVLRMCNRRMAQHYARRQTPLARQRTRRAVRWLVQSGPLKFLNRVGRPVIEAHDIEPLKALYGASWERACTIRAGLNQSG